MKKFMMYHPRLYAFFQNKAMNSIFIVLEISLLLTGCCNSLLLPLSAASVCFLFAIVYTLWFWIKRPQKVVINIWLSDMSTYMTLYFLIVAAMKNANELWYVFPAIIGIGILFISLLPPTPITSLQDKLFDIATQESSSIDHYV